MKTLYSRISQSRPLFYLGWHYFALFVLFLVLINVDAREVMGVNTWIKPSKFAISSGIFVWTIAWILPYFENYPKRQKFYAWAFATAFFVETGLIFFQGVRAVQSHFNTSTPLDTAVFTAMGFVVSIITLFAFVFLIDLLFLKKLTASREMKWAICLGLGLVLLASAVGAQMGGQLQHSVGGKDGTSGLFYLNWSTLVGDLRVAHFIGVHALQILPLIAYFFGRFQQHPHVRVGAVIFTMVLLSGLMLFAYLQAVMGIPFIAFE